MKRWKRGWVWYVSKRWQICRQTHSEIHALYLSLYHTHTHTHSLYWEMPSCHFLPAMRNKTHFPSKEKERDKRKRGERQRREKVISDIFVMRSPMITFKSKAKQLAICSYKKYHHSHGFFITLHYLLICVYTYIDPILHWSAFFTYLTLVYQCRMKPR